MGIIRRPPHGRWGEAALVATIVLLALTLSGLSGTAYYLATTPSLVRIGRYGIVGPKTRIAIRMSVRSIIFRTRALKNAQFYGTAPNVIGVEVWSGAGFHVVDFDLR